jgi:hypothetical protein
MQNISKRLIVAIIVLIIVIVAGGWFWYASVQREKASVANNEQFVPSTPNGEVSYSYKTVRISDGQIDFTFEVPSTWLTETRNMGEKPMNESEMREFFKTNRDGSKNSDYTNQHSLEQLDTLSFRQLEDELVASNRGDFLPDYPNASIASNNWIYYGDANGYQTDFYILSPQNAEKSWNFYAKDKSAKDITIAGRLSKIITIESDGGPGSGSRQILIPLTDSKILFINKQYYPENEVQSDFDHLLNTLKFE